MHHASLEHARLASRRRWLRVGGLAVGGLSLPRLLEVRGSAAAPTANMPGFGQAKSCIVVFLFGAPAHQDLWDMKPDSPAEVRGEFNPIDSSVPGIRLGEHIPRVAATAHRYAIIRSVEHPDNTHTVAMHYMLTGHRHLRPASNPRNESTDFPTFGAVLQQLRDGEGVLPRGISLNSPANQVSANNHIFPGFFAGFLGHGVDPLFIAQDPSKDDFRPIPSVEVGEASRYSERRRLLESVDAVRVQQSPGLGAFRDYHQRAFELVTSSAARAAFDLSAESSERRAAFGMNQFGQACLLARRLVEAGVPLITVNWARDDAFWDTHAQNFKLLKESLLPPFDVGFSSLLTDLDERGILDETLVICLGEFGRTPKINPNAGRDHWAACNSVVLAGAGIRGGQVIGSSDRIAAYPASRPVSPEDLSATIYHALGIDIRTTLYDSLARPHVLSTGSPVYELWS